MTRRSYYALAVITAGILTLTAQSLLLLPIQQVAISGFFYPGISAILAGIFYIVNFLCLGSIILNITQSARVATHLTASICFGALAFLYFENQFFIETFVFANLTLAQLFIIWTSSKNLNRALDITAGLLLLTNLFLSLTLLAIPQLLSAPEYSLLLSVRYPIGIAASLSTLASAATFIPQNGKTREYLYKFSSIPWIGLSVIYAVSLNISNLIPVVTLVVAILFTDLFPWSRFTLPKDAKLGQRIFAGAVALEVVLLYSFSVILFLAERADPILVQKPAVRDLAFLIFLIISAFINYGAFRINSILKGLLLLFGIIEKPEGSHDVQVVGPDVTPAQLIAPLSNFQSKLKTKQKLHEERVNQLSIQLHVEKKRTAQLMVLSELSQQLEAHLDQPVAAQLAVNAIQRVFDCSLSAVLTYDQDHDEFVTLAGAGKIMNSLPPGYRQNDQDGVIGRAARLRKTQVVNDTRLDSDFISFDKNETILSEVVVPLIHQGDLKGVLVLDNQHVNSFNSSDVTMIEAMASELLQAWDRTNYNQRLTHLIQAGVSLSTLLEPQAAIREIAVITKQTLEARFTFATLLDHEGNFTRYAHSGYAPNLLKFLSQDPSGNVLIRSALNSNRPFRVRDIRRYSGMSHVDIDQRSMRSVLAIPIRLHRLSVGAILAFGKQGEFFFTENDEPLANLLSSQAGAAIESAWLYQELRTTLNTTTLLYQLSFQVIQAETLYEAAAAIAETAQRIADANSTGIVLQTVKGEIEAKVEYDENGLHFGGDHPVDLVERTIQTGQNIFISNNEKTARICYPLQTPLRKYGAIWLEIPEGHWFNSRHAANLQTLTNQAAIALERAILLVDWQRQAKEIKDAYTELETTYDRTLAALMSALDARDRETEGHSSRVGKIACCLGEELGLTSSQLKALERGSLLHDIGKIGISDTILHKPGTLTPDEWMLMQEHPKIGSKIVEDIPFLQDTLPIIRYHQERWDGSGYPMGLSKTEIPLLARIFAVADAFDALTSRRPYRQSISVDEARIYLREQAGFLFDPTVVDVFDKLIVAGKLEEIFQML